MKKIFEVALGIVTSVGGFLEIGSIATAAQAGSEFGPRLIWAVALGGLCIVFLVEMSGRFAVASHHTIPGAIRERFGLVSFVAPLVGFLLVSVLVLAAEIGGACMALEMATGIHFAWWALPVAALVWLLLWKGPFGLIEKGISLLGLVTLCFVVGAFRAQPAGHAVLAGLVPRLPDHDPARYWFLAVSILGASISPYLFYFYASGALEDRWDESDFPMNRIVSGIGMGFGTAISIAVLVLAAALLRPHGLRVDHADQLGLLLLRFGRTGFVLVVVSLFIACVGAAAEIALECAYFLAQGMGWNWGKNQRPRESTRFSLVYTAILALGALPILAGIDPLGLTILTMAITAASLPLFTIPFLLLMNDEQYVGEHRNGWIGNAVVVVVIALGFVLAIVTIPLEIFGA